MSDYLRYRGKCKEMSEDLCKNDKSLVLVRGFYNCPLWGKQQHWWCKDSNGNILDPTVAQFPTKGAGATYEEFDGTIECSNCGAVVKESEASFESVYAFCSYKCHGKFIGVL